MAASFLLIQSFRNSRQLGDIRRDPPSDYAACSISSQPV
jgi:hypothetical protein